MQLGGLRLQLTVHVSQLKLGLLRFLCGFGFACE